MKPKQMMTRSYISSKIRAITRKDDTIRFHSDKNFPIGGGGLRELFDSNGWEQDTPLDVLIKALKLSSHLVYATCGGKIIGVARSMDDGCWSANIDCVCVHKDYQGKGIGTRIVSLLLAQLRCIPCISVSPNNITTEHFYTRLGFTRINGGGLLQKYNEGG